MKMLPEGTDLKIFHSNKNEYISKIYPDKCSYIELGNIDDYNGLLTSPDFWKNLLNYDRVLIFQTDSVIFRPGIEEFYPWSYVGSPWFFQDHGGNGGLSLRDPAIMYEICKNWPWEKHLGNEDVYFCNILNSGNIGNLAPKEVCLKFGVESVFSIGTFGGHAYWKYLSEEHCEQIKRQYENQH